jgi:hypothetical protein
MLYRIAAVAIIAFWLVMMTLLVRLETHPEETDILDVPVSYVLRVMLKHGQESLLSVRDGDKDLGTISVRPSITGSNARSIRLAGTLSLEMPMAARQRFNFNAAVDMDAALHATGFRLGLAMQLPNFHLSAQGDLIRNTIAYQLLSNGQQIGSQSLPMTASAIEPVLVQYLGPGAAAIPLSSGNGPPPTVTAREAQFTWRGQQLQVYQMTIRDGSAAIADIYVTQLGQIIQVNTNFGYTFAAEDY